MLILLYPVPHCATRLTISNCEQNHSPVQNSLMAFHHNQNKFQNLYHGLQALCDLITACLYEFTSQSLSSYLLHSSLLLVLFSSSTSVSLLSLHSGPCSNITSSDRLFPTCYLKKVDSFLMIYLFTLLCFASSNLHFPKWYYMLVNLFTDYVSD